MSTVWLVRWPQIAGKLSYWLSITGYKRGDRSLNEMLYRLYLVLFFAGWGFMVLSLVSSYTYEALARVTGEAAVPGAAAAIGVLALLAWLSYSAWRFARSSPLSFTEDDQHLICLTPVDRGAVALAWMIGDWVFSMPFFWAGGVILSFTVLEGSLVGETLVELLPYYLGAGVRATSIILPLHFGLMSLVYALGCLRLRGDRDFPRFPLIVRMVVLFLALGALLTILTRGLLNFFGLPWNILLAPLRLPVEAMLFSAPWLAGLAAAAGTAVLGPFLLRRAAQRMNLSRAAQETVQQESLNTAVWLGQTEVAEEIRRQQRLGTDHRPSLRGAAPGARMLPWKDQLQSRRYFRLQSVLAWLAPAGLTAAALLMPVLVVQAFALLMLADNLGRLLTTRLRADLSRWWLLRSLPFSSSRLLIYDLALPWLLATLLGWLVLALAAGMASVSTPPAVLVPLLVAAVGFASAADMARRSKTADLMVGSAAPVSEGGVLLAFACLGAVALALTYVGGFLALSLAFAMAYYTWKYAVGQLKKIG